MSDSTDINSPANDFLSGLHFDFAIKRLPTVSFMITRVNVPGLSLSNPPVSTPFKQFYVPADKLIFAPLSLTFKIDALMNNWVELYNWMISIGFPASFDQRSAAQTTGTGVSTLRSDATLLIKDYHKNDIINIDFHDLLPASLSSINLDAAVQNVPYIDAEVEFAYRDYIITQIKTTY